MEFTLAMKKEYICAITVCALRDDLRNGPLTGDALTTTANKSFCSKDGEHTTAHLCKSKEKTKVATTSVDVQKMKTKADSVDVEPKKTTDASMEEEQKQTTTPTSMEVDHKAGVDDPLEYPTLLDEMMSITFAFRVKWLKEFVLCSVLECKDSKVLVDKIRNQLNNGIAITMIEDALSESNLEAQSSRNSLSLRTTKMMLTLSLYA
ncbi:hypothetical protein P8452_02484 [Trifolium repens]|nr:hypothetical protein P8452_02484 [Trifolium repens]